MQYPAPSGLFPAGPHRPTYREPHPIRVSAAVAGAGMAVAWQVLLAGFSDTLRELFWRLVIAVAVAACVAVLLLRFGDRGVATGVGLAATLGGCAATVLVTVLWLTVGWPLW